MTNSRHKKFLASKTSPIIEKRSHISSWIPATKIKKPNKINGVVEFFKENTNSPALNKLVSQVEQRQHLQACLYEALESVNLGNLASEIEPGVISPAGELKLQVSQGSVGAKLKQRLPSLATYLRKSGWEIQSLSVRVTPGLSISAKAKILNSQLMSHKVMPESGKNAWANLAKSLPEDSKLLDSIKLLLEKVSNK
jgi:hypothetical protein